LALDYEVLVNAVSVKYPHVSGHVFIEKMVQVPFRVPRLELTQATFLDDLVPNWTMQHAGSVPGGFADVAYEVSTLGLGANPRQIKRFINSTLVLLRVAEQKALSVDPDLLAGVVGLQLKWPGEYQDFADAVMNDDPSPVSGLVEADEPELQRYSKRFFRTEMTSAELRPVLNLTHAVGPAEAASAYSDSIVAPSVPIPGGATALREVNRQRVIDALAANGFGQIRPNSEAYYLADRPNLRVKIGKTVVRFEERDIEGEWRLGVSALLTQDVDYSLTLIANPERLAQDVRAGVTKYFSPDAFVTT
ncbi:MAG TPA: P-loop NTPase fold protein, partial [Jatrophihabitantaceae bacterium]|nr:P-loop NTPase fold protein [Jatrophihabitantaceae bacterium]